MTIQVPFVVRFHIYFFQIIGCFDTSLHTQPTRQKLAERRLITWTNLLSLTFCLTTVNTFFRPDAFLFTRNRFGYFNDVLKVVIAQITVFIIYLETVLRRYALRNFWQKYVILNQAKQIEELETKQKDWRKSLRTHRRFLYIFYGITIFDFFVEAIFLIFRVPNQHILQFWIMFTPYMYIVHLRNMQIIFHIEIIRHELEKLRNDISLLAEYTSFANRVVPFVGFESFVRRKLAEKQLLFQHIYEMFDYFQQAYGVSTIAVLLTVYVRVVVDAYFMFYNDLFGQESLGLPENLLMLPAYLEIPALLLTSQKCMNVLKFIAFELHNIRGSVENSIISVQIQNFSLQMLHQKIRIDGLGISPLDGKMLISIVGSITTYMVFFIQFMPKFRNL